MTKTQRHAEYTRLMAAADTAKATAATVEKSDPILASSERARAARLVRNAKAILSGR